MFSLLLIVIYASFISLGLPDSLLGAAWPSIYPELGVPISYSGILFFIISAGTVISSLMSDRLIRRLGTGRVTAISVGMTAAALFGFSVSRSFPLLCLWAIPYGLGAGSVDAALNNYVALHLASRHMSWLHCMWGIGASVGPYIMGFALSRGAGWPMGYRIISLIQIALTAFLVFTLPIWKEGGSTEAAETDAPAKPLGFRETLHLPGLKEILVTFFCYCALEQTTSLWGSSYLVLCKGLSPETAASFASLFFLGITLGRVINGFLTFKLNDTQMIRLGQGIIAAGLLFFLLPLGAYTALIGLFLIGLGCAPIYPSIIHATPTYFGPERSQAVIGIEMACAYIGNCLMPPLFGLIAGKITVALLPWYLLILLALMVLMHKTLLKKRKERL